MENYSNYLAFLLLGQPGKVFIEMNSDKTCNSLMFKIFNL